MPQKKKTAPKKALPNKAQLKAKEKASSEQRKDRTDTHRTAYVDLEIPTHNPTGNNPEMEIQEYNTTNTRGRPKQAGDMKKITLTVSHDQIVWLDRLTIDIREASRATIDRGTIIRALISALENSGIDIKHCSSEREIQEIITRKLMSKG